MPTVNPITSAGEERVANKIWINGQILYQKDIKIDSVSGATSFFDTGEEFDQLDQLYMIEGIGYISSINNYKTYNDKSSDINVTYDKDTAYIRILIDSYSGYGTITDNTISFYYTKAEKARFRATREAAEEEIYYPVTGVNVNGVSVLDVERVAQIKSYKEITQAEYDALPDTKRSDGVMYCIRDSAPSGQDQGVLDVQLDGVSVVDRYGIANLEGMATALDLAKKQDLLVEGNNITMTRLGDGTVRISASGGGGGLTDVTVNGTSVVSGSVAIITIPTKTSDLTNDSNFITMTVNNLTNYYTKTQTEDLIDTKISEIPSVNIPVKDVKVDNVSVVDANGDANISLSGKQDTLIAGTGISIANRIISAPSMVGATQSADGTGGGVPLPLITDKDKYLKGDGTWDTPPGGVYNDFVGATAQSVGSHGLVPAPNIAAKDKFLKGDGTWADSASAVSELTDVDLTSLIDGQILKYDATNQKWVNDNAGGGNVDDVKVNGVSVVDANKEAQIKSYKELTRSQYDALPDSKYTDGILYCITDSGSSKSDFFSPIVYSLDEREVGVWTDGKPLYQKTIVVSSFTWDIGSTVAEALVTFSSVGLSDIDSIFFESVYQKRTSGTIVNLNYAFPSGNEQNQAHIRPQRSDFYFLVASNTVNSIQYVCMTVKYTKTTDVAGSGKWGQDGVPAVHYSTDEKVIGTWIDGSTLYEKTYVYTDGNKNKTIDISSLNIGVLVECVGKFTRYAPYASAYIDYSFNTWESSSVNSVLRTDKTNNTYTIGYAITLSNSQDTVPFAIVTVRYTKSS